MLAKQHPAALLALAATVLAAPAAEPQAAFFAAPAGAPPPGPPAPPQVPHTDVASHGPFSGTPTTTGALSTTVTGTAIPALPANPAETTYPADGALHDPQPAPYTPNGGLGTNGTEPVYKPQSDFDYESLVRGSTSPCRRVWLTLARHSHCIRSGSSSIFSTMALPHSRPRTLRRPGSRPKTDT